MIRTRYLLHPDEKTLARRFLEYEIRGLPVLAKKTLKKGIDEYRETFLYSLQEERKNQSY